MKKFPFTHRFAVTLGAFRPHILFGGLMTFFCMGLLATTGGAQTFFANHERAGQAPEQLAKGSSGVERRAAESFGILPLSFEPNVGQTDSQVRFLSRGDGYTLFLKSQEAVLTLKKPVAKSRSAGAPGWPSLSQPAEPNGNPAVLRMRLLGASVRAPAEGIGQLPGKSNYFLGDDWTQWHTDVANYAKVRFHDVYPGVDLVYYGNQRQMEYDFVVSPGANPSAIRLQFDGSDSVKVEPRGDLVVSIRGEDIRFRQPAVYQPADASEGAPVEREQSVVRAGWTVEGKDAARFEIGSYDPRRPLVIDPVLVYSTYLGGSNLSGGGAIAVDSAGSVYVAGSTNSADFPVSSSAFQRTYGGNSTSCSTNNDCGDVFVTKLDPSGTTIVYSTFLGGSNDEHGLGIALDAAGDAYITGVSSSLNFPTTSGAFQTTCKGCNPLIQRQDAFVTKLNPTGSALIYSTFLGGSADNWASSVAVDSSGNAYIAGWTASPDFPVTNGAFQTTITTDHSDAFVSKLNPAGSALVYSTFLGGGAVTYGGTTGIAIDSARSAYVTGTTNDSNFPTTPGAFQIPFALGTTPGSIPFSSYVTKLNSAGSGLVYSSLYSGWSSRIVVDSLGSAYVAGRSGPIFPTTPGALNGNCSVGGFLSKFTPDGSNLIYSDYFCDQPEVPGRQAFDVYALALDSSGNAHLAGGTDSTNFPTTSGAFQNQIGNACCFSDGILMKVTPGGAVAYSTYLGGNSTDMIFGVVADDSGNAYLTGFTSSTDFPTQNPIKASLSASFDAFATKISTSSTSLSAWPAVVTFGDQGLMTNSSPLPVYVANASNASIELSGIAVAGNFTQTNDCPASLAPGVQCRISVVFNPQAAGSIAGTLTITPGGAAEPLSIQLGGNGVDGPVVVLTPAAPSWPGQPFGFASPPRSITLTNVGNKQLNIDGVSILGPFGLAGNDCSTVLPQASCSVQLTFTPFPTGGGNPIIGEITFLDGAGTGPQSLQLTGLGVDPGVVFSDPGLKFPDEPVGTASATQSVFLVNGLSTPITLNSISASADFIQTNTCGATLASHAYCGLNVAFDPTINGLRRGTVTVNDTGAGSPHVLFLLGAGVGGQVELSVSELNFGTELVGSASAAQTVTLNNSGATALTISSIVAAAGFNQTNTCGTSLAAGASCAINVSFAPTSTGVQSDNLTITTNSVPAIAAVALTGTGTAAVVSLSSTSLAFGAQLVNTPSSSQALTLANTGNLALTITSVAVSGDFSQTNTCGASVAAGGNCVINVTFTPTANGARSGSLTLTDNSSGSPQTVTLSGTGTVPSVSLSSPLAFSAQLAGTTSASQTVTLTNTGSSTLNLTAIGVTGPFAIASSGTTCSTSTPVAASATCAVAVTFTPTAAGTASGSLSFSDNALNSPQTVGLSGTGQDFTFAPPFGSSTTSTVVRGQPATYTLSVGGQGGLSGTVTFTCTGAPSEATCTVSPNPATAGSSATNVTVTVTTTAATFGAPRSRPFPPVPPLSGGLRGWWMLALVLAAMAWAFVRSIRSGVNRWQSAMLLLASGLLLSLAVAGCGGGGGGGGGTTHDPGTPVGTYSLAVTGTTGSGSSTLSHSMTLMLTVN